MKVDEKNDKMKWMGWKRGWIQSLDKRVKNIIFPAIDITALSFVGPLIDELLSISRYSILGLCILLIIMIDYTFNLPVTH